MPLRRTQVTIPILGLDTNADPKSAPPGTCDLIENMVFKRTAVGGAELRKRFGMTARSQTLISGGSVTSGRKLVQLNDEQLIISGNSPPKLHSWDPQSSKWDDLTFVDGGFQFPQLPQTILSVDTVSTRVPISTSATDGLTHVGMIDMAVGGGYLCVVHTGSGSGHAVVINLTTGVHVFDGQLLFTNPPREIRVVALATVFMILSNSSSANLLARSIAYATPETLSSITTVASNMSAVGSGNQWDMIRNGSNDSVLVAYRSTVPDTKILIWNSNMTSGGTVANANVPDQGLAWLGWDGSDGNEYLSYVSSAGGGLKTHTVTQAGPTISATTVHDAAVITGKGITGYRTSGINTVFIQQAGATRNLDFIQRSNGGAVIVYQLGMGLTHRAFTHGATNLWYVGMTYDNSDTLAPSTGIALDERTYFIMDVTATAAFTAQIVARALFGEGGGFPPFRGLGSCPAVDSARHAIPLRRAMLTSSPTPATLVLPIKTFSAQLMTLDFGFSGVGPHIQIGETLYAPGGAVAAYDGRSFQPTGFPLVPEYPTLVASNGASLLTPSSTYQVCIVWACVNNRGQIERSSPSQSASVTLGPTDDTITITVQTNRLSLRLEFIEVYMTVANGSTFFLVDSSTSSNQIDSFNFVTVNFLSDTRIQQGEQLYTGDGTLAHVPLPPARLMASWRNRMFLAGTEDPTDLWVSNERISGEGLSFSDANVITMEKEGGAITALAEMDDRLVIFKRSSVYELTGAGPAPNGDGQFDQPARITATVGTTSPDSVIKTPQGLIFKSLRGFYLLPIGGGLPLRLRSPESFESLTVTGAAVMDDVEQVRFVTSAGTTLVYHFGILDQFGLGRWTTFTGQTAVDCAVFGGKFVFLTSAGVLQEENALFNDNGSSYVAKARLAWISPAALFGDVRVWAMRPVTDMLAALGSLTLQILMEVDFTATVIQVAGISVLPSTNGSPPFELRPVIQDASAYRLTIQVGSIAESFRLSAWVFELGVHGLLRPIAATQRLT